MASVCGREFVSPVVAHLVGREERQVGGGPAAARPSARACSSRPARRRCPTARSPRATASPTGSTCRCCARTSWPRAGSSSTARSRGASSTTGAPRRRASPPRSPGTARRGATTRGPSPSGGTPATTRPGSSPTRRRKSTTTGPSARSRSCPPRAAPPPRSPSTGAGARCGSPRPASTTPPPTSSRCWRSREGPGLPAAERAALAGLCDALFYRPAGRGDGGPRPGAARGGHARGRGRRRAEAQARIGQALVGQGRLRRGDPAAGRGHRLRPPGRRAGGAQDRAQPIAASCTTGRPSTRPPRPPASRPCRSATELGDGFYALAARMFLGLARVNLGRISEALDDFADAIAMARRNDDRYWLPRLTSHLGWVHRELGALDRAREHDTEAVRLARERPVPGARSRRCSSTCASTTSGRDRPSGPPPCWRSSRRGRRESSWMRWMSELRLAAASAEHWAVRGDHQRTVEHAAQLAEIARRLGAREYRCAAERIRTESALARARTSRTRRPAWPRPSASCEAGPPRSRPGSRRGCSRSSGAGSATRRELARPSRRRPAP